MKELKQLLMREMTDLFLLLFWPILGMYVTSMYGADQILYWLPLICMGLFFGFKNLIQKVKLDKKANSKNKEYILCAANHYDDGKEHVHQPKNIKTGFVTCGRRHHNCISTYALIVGFPYDENGIKLMNTEEQGFLTNENRFVSREEAGRIAFAAGQTEELIEKLHSEDLY